MSPDTQAPGPVPWNTTGEPRGRDLTISLRDPPPEPDRPVRGVSGRRQKSRLVFLGGLLRLGHRRRLGLHSADGPLPS